MGELSREINPHLCTGTYTQTTASAPHLDGALHVEISNSATATDLSLIESHKERNRTAVLYFKMGKKAKAPNEKKGAKITFTFHSEVITCVHKRRLDRN